MKVVFVQPGQFLRTSRKTNPFFDPIIDVCQENGIDWKLYLPSVRVETGYPKDHIRDYHRFSFLSKWFWRMAHVLLPWLSVARVHWLHGFFARPFCREWRDADLVITIAQTYSNELVAMRPERRVVDVQHGVIYSNHTGYFSAHGLLRKELRGYLNYEFWLYGPGYANCFFKNPENSRWLDGRVKVVGDVVRHEVVMTGEDCRRLIVVSGQFKPESDRVCMLDQVNGLRTFLKCFYAKYGSRYQVMIRHHPRFCGIAELDALHGEFPQFTETKEPWSALYGRMYLHVTFSSTVVFDAASNGIPSYFLMPSDPQDTVLENVFWRDDYACPFYGKSLDEMMADAGRAMVRADTRKWYGQFYAPFDETNCLQLLKGGI